jgi:hypothetical protein
LKQGKLYPFERLFEGLVANMGQFLSASIAIIMFINNIFAKSAIKRDATKRQIATMIVAAGAAALSGVLPDARPCQPALRLFA